MLLTKEQILNADDLNADTVEVPEWGGDVPIRELTGTARERFEQVLVQADKSPNADANVRASLVALSIVDEAGDLMFNVNEITALGKKSVKALDRVFKAAKKLNAMDEVEEEIKN